MLLHDREKLRRLYAAALLDDVIPFWLRHAPDPEHGGHFTCLDRTGKVHDTLKAVWLQLPIMQSGPTSGRLVVDKTIP